MCKPIMVVEQQKRKKTQGFSLIELLIAVAILAIVMGALVHLFGSSVTSMQAGNNQQVAYEEARIVINELKTTLRYADKISISPLKPLSDTSKMTYTGTIFDKHNDLSNGVNKSYTVLIQWITDPDDSAKERLSITKTMNGKETITIFPKSSQNNAFTAESPFPIVLEDVGNLQVAGASVALYEITLPVQYLIDGAMKVSRLTTKVNPLSKDDGESIEEKMRRLYNEILTVGLKGGNNLTPNEERVKQEVEAYWQGSGANYFYFKNNDKIREYMFEKLYNRLWPKAQLTTASGTTIDIYIQPANHVRTDINNTYLFGRDGDGNNSNSGWNHKVIYNHEEKTWQVGSAFSNTSTWESIKNQMNSRGFQAVSKIEYK